MNQPAARPTDNAAYLDAAIAHLRGMREDLSACLDRLDGKPQIGLSPAERAFIPEANARARSDLMERAAEAASKAAAIKILREELADISWEALKTHPTRGEVAARLLGTWEERNVDEPITEHADEVRGLLKNAMYAHGTSDWFDHCQVLGDAIALRAIKYVLDCHGNDADDATAYIGGREEA